MPYTDEPHENIAPGGWGPGGHPLKHHKKPIADPWLGVYYTEQPLLERIVSNLIRLSAAETIRQTLGLQDVIRRERLELDKERSRNPRDDSPALVRALHVLWTKLREDNKDLPEVCPYALNQVLDTNFFPDFTHPCSPDYIESIRPPGWRVETWRNTWQCASALTRDQLFGFTSKYMAGLSAFSKAELLDILPEIGQPAARLLVNEVRGEPPNPWPNWK